MPAIWIQNYNPTGSVFASTSLAGLPVLVLLGCIAFLQVRIHRSALIALAVALLLALVVYRMPWQSAGAAALYGAAFGFFPIGWIILNVIFLYQLTLKRGLFDVLRQSIVRIAPDPRVQVILIAFAFGAFIEGVAGFGAPVAITGAILIQLGFTPLHAAGLALIANTAPVAFGSVGIPITTLEQVTGLSAIQLSAMVGRQLPFFSLIIPFWVVGAFAGWRGIRAVWPVGLAAGVAFAVPQFLISNLHGPWLVDTISAACSIAAIVIVLQFWRPDLSQCGADEPDSGESEIVEKDLIESNSNAGTVRQEWGVDAALRTESEGEPQLKQFSDAVRTLTWCERCAPTLFAWLPWVVLTLFILLWGTPAFKKHVDSAFAPKISAPYLHNTVQRAPPVAPTGAKPEKAEFNLNLLSATGTAILCAALVSGTIMGYRPAELWQVYKETIWRVRFSLLTIAAMLALGNVTKYSGADATLGLALARTGRLYPFCGTLLGWLGVALTGSDTASNVLFGSLQKITAEQNGISPILMGAANSSGGVMGKMIDAQSIVVASTATNWYGYEGSVLKFVFLHSLVLAVLMGVLVFLQAYVWPFSAMVVK